MIDIPSSNSDSPFDDEDSQRVVRSPDHHARVEEPIAPGAAPGRTTRLTAELPGIGGRLKDSPEDFVVDEIPLYEPSGHGEHLYLRVEKRDLSHERMVEHLGRVLNVSRHDIGTAGMKDRRAVTRQWVSVPARCHDRLGQVEKDDVRVLDATRHTNALKTGHCKGNRFSIRIQGTDSNAAERAQPIAEMMREKGCPNYYGSQRFGAGGETLSIGYQLVTGLKKQASIPKARRKFLVRLSLSALQSAIFNDVLAARLDADLYGTVLEGDVMTFPGSRSVFEVVDPTAEQRRFDAGEILITGPMVGVKMRGPSGLPAEKERSAVEARGLRLGQFAAWKSIAPGGRRALAVRPDFHAIENEDDAMRVEMTLPTGSFATVVLDELMKL